MTEHEEALGYKCRSHQSMAPRARRHRSGRLKPGAGVLGLAACRHAETEGCVGVSVLSSRFHQCINREHWIAAHPGVSWWRQTGPWPSQHLLERASMRFRRCALMPRVELGSLCSGASSSYLKKLEAVPVWTPARIPRIVRVWAKTSTPCAQPASLPHAHLLGSANTKTVTNRRGNRPHSRPCRSPLRESPLL